LAAHALGQPPQLFRFNLGNPPSASDDLTATEPARAAELNNRLTAFAVTGLHLLTRKR